MTQPPRTPEAAPLDDTGQDLPDGRVADAVKGNWVDHLAPAFARPYLRLSRADRPIGTWLLFIPCLWGVALAAAADPAGFAAWDAWIVLGCGLGAFLMRGAGCTWNDITDRRFDAQVARTRSRPIPSGQVSVRQALAWMVIQSLLGAVILFTFNATAIALGVASLALVAVYPFAKRFTWWPQVFLGLAFNWGALLAWAAHSGTLTLAPVVLWVAGITWTLFYDTIYAHQDKEDDALIGVKSTARLFGENTHAWLRGFMVATLLLMTLAILLAILPAASALQLVVALGGVWGFGWHMAWQLARLDTEDPDRCLTLFRANRDAGLIPALFLAVAVLV
ncbi:4-hydroxybenzoate octaprenyltransferase [Aliigemmobacter aestuarii]|uniref:4-hydroxybenzoate octaprenyltransferase n=1 Tax=Aliigemmobacter aestuarii TaxID=1445661 RepID=UPI001454CD4F|nr:4-hydroxybenzoate octaprenyltransferase [Gemmobacter aestuarii]